MISVRLEPELEQRLNYLSEKRKVSKSQIIKDSLGMYFQAIDDENNAKTPFQLGEDLFGRYASGDTDRSVTYKEKVRERIRAKNTHR